MTSFGPISDLFRAENVTSIWGIKRSLWRSWKKSQDDVVSKSMPKTTVINKHISNLCFSIKTHFPWDDHPTNPSRLFHDKPSPNLTHTKNIEYCAFCPSMLIASWAADRYKRSWATQRRFRQRSGVRKNGANFCGILKGFRAGKHIQNIDIQTCIDQKGPSQNQENVKCTNFLICMIYSCVTQTLFVHFYIYAIFP